ncbi:MAG: vWA domain-containing protein [Halobacteriota archaeon]
MNTKNSKKIVSTFAAIIVISMLAAMSVGNVAANGNVTVQVGLILDGSGSINATEWAIITEGVASAVENSSCLPDDGTVELTVVQFSNTASVEVGPVVIDAASAPTVATQIRAIGQMGGSTCIACGFHVAADALYNSINFNTSIKQVLNLATDGSPNICDPAWPCPDAKTNAVSARDYAISLLGMDTDPNDEIDAEGIGISDANRAWLKDNIVWPQPGSIAPPYVPGWVKVVADADEFAESMCEKFKQVVPDDWAEINKELDALITNVSAADMPNIIKQRLVDKLVYAKELKDNAHEECLAGNFDGATKKLGVAKNQVESFASMVEITRRITPEDKASFLADATEIIGKIDRLIEHIETEHSC